jgi:hypothetical protein
MGLSGSKKKTTTTPVYDKQLTGAANTVSKAYNQQAPYIGKATQAINSLIPSLTDSARQGIGVSNAAAQYNTDVLDGRYLGEDNPYLQQMIDQTGNDVRNQYEASLGTRGLTGGSSYADIISRNLANNATNLRYNDYDLERGRMAAAAGQAPGMASSSLGNLAGAAQAQTLPISAASGYGSTIGGLLGSYTNSTEKNSGGLFNSLLGAAGLGLQGYKILSDRRAKTDIHRVGRTDGGLPVYTFRYKHGGPVHMGVMAQDVAEAQPEALGGMIGGFHTVDYGAVR